MKNQGNFGIVSVIIIMIITFLVTSLATGVIMINSDNGLSYSNASYKNDQDLQEFVEVYNTLLSKYYDSNIDKTSMLKEAKKAMINYLNDQYTSYLDVDNYNSLIDDLSGSYVGIGIEILDNTIVNVFKESPADKQGLEIGDILTKVNDVEINKEFLENGSIPDLIKNSSDAIKLEIERNGNKKNYVIEKNILNYGVFYELLEEDNIGYIYLKTFSKNLKDQIKDALHELEENSIDGLIIDLRYNAGGYLQSAEEASSLFLEEGKVIYSLQSGKKVETHRDKTKEKRDYKIVILMNKYSASASEIFAAALKYSYGAAIVGETSYGKGKVQQLVELNSGDTLKYSVAKWLTPNGDCIDEKGLLPDYEVEYEKGDFYDTQLEKAIEVINS